MDYDKTVQLNRTAIQQVIKHRSRLMELHQTLISSFDFDANQIFKLLSNNGEFVTGEDLLAFFAESGREISREEVGCLLRVVDKRGEGQLYIGDFKHFLATLGLKKEH
jgi:Ca2+-binding EF-hand superfamily protein